MYEPKLAAATVDDGGGPGSVLSSDLLPLGYLETDGQLFLTALDVRHSELVRFDAAAVAAAVRAQGGLGAAGEEEAPLELFPYTRAAVDRERARRDEEEAAAWGGLGGAGGAHGEDEPAAQQPGGWAGFPAAATVEAGGGGSAAAGDEVDALHKRERHSRHAG